MNGNRYLVCGEGEWRADRILHEIGLGCGCRSGRQGEGDVGLLARPLDDTEDESVVVFSFFDRCQQNVLRLD